MGAYEYQALDARGKRRKGVASGDSAKLLRQQLREQGLTPIKVEPVQEQQAGGREQGARGGRQKISGTELAVITRQFAILLDSGMTIEGTLGGLIEQAESHTVKSTLSGVRSMIMEGRSLAEALRAFPRSFPELYTASVAAGEQTGHLEEVLERLADYTEARQGLQQRIGVALVYPIILTVVSILIVVGLMTYVVPQVVRVFEDTGQTLPLLTRILIGISEFLQRYGLLIAAVLAAGFLLLAILLRYPKPKYAFHGLLLATPGVKRLSRGLNTARMARTLAILIGSGVPLLSALRSSA
ncbi:MAG: type II secretion system F family protein, partial [Pseudomonadota bacterium]|nr:type II secretion system F family protein [Pseudomonadota bacterium]